jgi:two-component sensor histidine kinase
MVRRLTLRTRLALLVTAASLPLLLLSLTTIYLGYRDSRAQAAKQGLDVARGLALAIEGELRGRILALEVLANSRALALGDLETFRAEAQAVVQRQAPGSNILLLAADGQQLMNTAAPPGAALPRREHLDNLRRVLASGQPAVSDLYFGLVVRRPVIAIEIPVPRPPGAPGLVLALNPTLEGFASLVRRQHPGPDWYVAILDRDGNRIARHPQGERYVGTAVTAGMLEAWRSGAMAGTQPARTPEGVPVLSAFVRLPEPYGWGAAVAVSEASLTRPALRSLLLALGAGLALLALSLMLARWIALGVLRPITRLLRLAASVTADGGGRAPPLGLPEADRLAESLLVEASRRQAATAALMDSERRLRLVVAELNHRAKNALATVQSLALQTARGAPDTAGFNESFMARLRSLARAHDLLAAFSWEGAALGSVVRAGLAPWLEEDGAPARVILHCPEELALPLIAPGQAQALVMALHELATNASKYGALSAQGGAVEIACTGDPAGRIAEVAWRERGGPSVAGPPARQGFGLRLLERALVRDLGPGASVSLQFDPGGVAARIRFAPRPGTGAAAIPA